MNVTDDDLQRAIEESMRGHQPRAAPSLDDSVDDALMAKALEESLAMEKHRMAAAKSTTEEDHYLKMAIEQSMRESEQGNSGVSSRSGSGVSSSTTSTAKRKPSFSYASAVSIRTDGPRTNVRKREQLLPSENDDEDPMLKAAIHASISQDQKEMARQTKAENRKAKKKMKKNQRMLPDGYKSHGSGSRGSGYGYSDTFDLPNPTNFERRRMSGGGRRKSSNVVDLTSEAQNSGTKSTKGGNIKSTSRMSIKDIKDELRRMRVPFSDCFTRADLENRLTIALETASDGASGRRRGNSYSSLGDSKGNGRSVKTRGATGGNAKVDPKALEEAQQAAELVEREDLLSVLPDEIRMKAEVLYAEAMDQYTRILGTRNGSRLVKKPHIRDSIRKARQQVKNEQRARMDEAKRKMKEEERKIQEVVEQAEREEQLSVLPENVRIEAEMIFANMMSDFQRRGGRKPRMDYAISLATDKIKEQQRQREEELKKIQEQKLAEERKAKEAEEEKIRAAKEAEEKKIQARNNESRSARAARFAAAYEKRMAASKSNKNDENNPGQTGKK